MTIAGIITLLIVVLFALHGMKKGLVRKLSGLLSVIIASALVNQMLPYVTEALKTRTPLYDWIDARCEQVIEKQILSAVPIPEEAAGYAFGGEAAGVLNTLGKVEQTDLIRSLPVPDFLKKMMINFNNSEGYRRLGAADFTQYLTRFAANIILNIVAFLVTMVLTWLVVRGILTGLNLFSRLPVLRFADRAGGLIAGALQGLFVVWILYLLVSLSSGTPQGMAIQERIGQSFVLEPLYDANIFLKIVSSSMEKMF